MKKVLLTAMALLTIASASAFGMYGRGDSWIDFLIHGNQLRARMDQFGFVLGNGTIKGTLGFRANTVGFFAPQAKWGNILSSGANGTSLDSTLSAGIGYTSDVFGIGVGYNFTYVEKDFYVHTPVLMINALNNNLRISIPIQVAVASETVKDIDNPYPSEVKGKFTGVAFDNIQLRYYTGIDAFNAIRFYVYYKYANFEGDFLQNPGNVTINSTAETLGFQLRLYFLNTTVGNVNINPFVRLEYHTALRGDKLKGYRAEGYEADLAPVKITSESYSLEIKQSDLYDVYPYEFSIKPVLGITANSDIVSLYVEPSLGYTVSGSKPKEADAVSTHKLAWGAYTELYVRPVQDLEWYFEMDVNNSDVDGTGVPVTFATSTGITWYLPSLGGAQ